MFASFAENKYEEVVDDFLVVPLLNKAALSDALAASWACSIALSWLCPNFRSWNIPRMPRRLPAAVLPQVRQRQLASPYGKTHVTTLKPRRLPPPVVPLFPQQVTLSDGSTFTHYTTSPKSSIRLTKDISNSPLWTLSSQRAAEETLTGRVGRFKQKFEGGGTFDASKFAQLEEYVQEATNIPKKFKK